MSPIIDDSIFNRVFNEKGNNPKVCNPLEIERVLVWPTHVTYNYTNLFLFWGETTYLYLFLDISTIKTRN